MEGFENDPYEVYKREQARKGEPALNINAWYKEELQKLRLEEGLEGDNMDGFEFDKEIFDI